MRVHIERRHGGVGNPVPNYLNVKTFSTAVDQNPFLRDNGSKFYYNNNLRRFLPFSGPIQNLNYMFPPTEFNSFPHSFEAWKTVTDTMDEFMNLSSRLSFGRAQVDHPLVNDYAGLAQSLNKSQHGHARIGRSILNNYRSNGIDYEQVLGFHVDACPECLDICSVPIYKENGMDIEEQIKKIRSTKIHCRPESPVRVITLSPSQRHTYFIKLQGEIKFYMINEVHDWLQNCTPYLKSLKLQSTQEYGCINFRESDRDFGFIGRAIKNGQTALQKEELMDFLLICKFRYTAAYIGIVRNSDCAYHSKPCPYALFICKM